MRNKVTEYDTKEEQDKAARIVMRSIQRKRLDDETFFYANKTY